MTMTLIETIEIGVGGAATLTFSNIPQTGTDIMLLLSHRNDGGANQDNITLRINGLSGSNYVSRRLEGNGSTVLSGNQTATSINQPYSNSASSTANTFTNTSYYFSNYALTGTKSISIDTVMENNGTGYQQLFACLYNSSISGITSITISGYYNMVRYTSASLYMITKGSGGATVS
jgi:hypothetical protein